MDMLSRSICCDRGEIMQGNSIDLKWLLGDISLRDLDTAILNNDSILIQGRGNNYYNCLFSFDDAEALTNRRDLFYPFVRLYDGTSRVDVSDYTDNLSFSGINVPFYVSRETLRNRIASGNTAYFTGIERISTSCLALKVQLEAALIATVDLSLFVTPSNTVGNLPRHYDNVDGLILQISGRKTWKLWGIAATDPLLVEKRSNVSEMATDDNVHATYTLEAGDLLFVPAGMIHETDTTDDHSIHITVGVTPFRWYNVMSDYLAPRLAGPRPAPRLQLGEAINSLRERLLNGRYPSRPGLIGSRIMGVDLDDQRRLLWARWIPTHIRDLGNQIEIFFHGNKLRLPKTCHKMVRKLHDAQSAVAIRDLLAAGHEELCLKALSALLDNGIAVKDIGGT
ncbi:cupin [Gluconobacter oxydans]|nr:hypothetical protein B932_3351 [Gluconobacter oxydans H24]ANQ41686.1 cupin [Gluconobacter oxydans]